MTACQSLRSNAFTAKKLLEGAPSAGQSKKTKPKTHHVRTQLPNDVQCFFGSTTTPRSIHAATRPSQTLAHVDHRLNSPKPLCTQPTSVYKGRLDPTKGEDKNSAISDRSFGSLLNSSSSVLRLEPPQRSIKSSSTLSIIFTSLTRKKSHANN